MTTSRGVHRERIAVYGGSFDPVHLGHLRLALAAVREGAADRTVFMPNAISPFKREQKIAPAEHRLAMLRIAAEPYEALSVSSYETDFGRSAYTIETLEALEKVTDAELCFLLGMDSLVQLDCWYRGEDILRRYPLITADRPGEDVDERDAVIRRFEDTYGTRIHLLELTPKDYSSSEIRARIQNGERCDELLPPHVEEYILEHGLYR